MSEFDRRNSGAHGGGGSLSRKFKGKNGLSTKASFHQRKYYEFYALPKGENGRPYRYPFVNFDFAERCMYGRINRGHYSIQVDKANLVSLTSQTATTSDLRAINFVAAAFKGFVAEFKKAAIAGTIESDPYLYDIKPVRAHTDVDEIYTDYMSSIKGVFLNKFLTQERSEKIVDFDGFSKLFFEYVYEMSKTNPINKISYITSKYCGPMISGLSIDLTDLDASDDSDKELIINSNNFEFYQLVARKHGFSIDRNVPWRLTADIGSEAMLRYSSQFGASTDDAVLNNFFTVAGGKAITDLQKMAIDTYNSFVDSNPRLRVNKICKDGKTVSKYYERSRVTIQDVISKYPTYFWLDKYVDIRYNEQKEPVSPGELSSIKKTVRKLLKTATIKSVLSYVNGVIKDYDNFKGSFADRRLSRQEVKTGQKFNPTY